MKKLTYAFIAFLSFMCVPLCAQTRNASYKIGDTGPGGGIVFYIDGNRRYEAKEVFVAYKWQTAVNKCEEYCANGYDDWYLPTKYELNLIYQNLRKVGKISGCSSYWSSSQSDDKAWLQSFGSGKQSLQYKELNYCLWAVRTF
ncbi:MAG: DUF1566 domain-containing protein [Treponema sp.]|nr:DUF1566 domain-containing protein [Treponema sp.]